MIRKRVDPHLIVHIQRKELLLKISWKNRGRPPNGIFAHLIFQESEIRDLFGFLITEKNLFEKRLIITNGERKHRYVLIESEFKDCIACCITKLYSEVESRMFYIWKTVRRPRRLEKEWFELIHGSEKWQEIEISHFQNRAYINEIEKELKKRKINPKKTDPKTIDILKRPIVKNGVYVSYMDKKMAQERIDEWD